MRLLLQCSAVLMGLSLIAVSKVTASCGSLTCPLDTRSSFTSGKGVIRLGYEFQYIDQDQPQIGRHNASVGEIHGHHDEVRTINRVHRFLGSWGLTNRLNLDLALPLVSRSHRHVHNHHGQPLPDGWDFTHVGDLTVQARIALNQPGRESFPTFFGIAGIEFPTGDSTIVNGTGGEAEPGITPGSKSYDALVGGASLQHFSVPTLRGEFAAMPLIVSILYKANTKGRDDYRLGNTLTGTLGTTYPLSASWGLINQLNVIVREKDEKGLTFEEVEKTGGEYVYYSPGVQLRVGEKWEWSTVVQLPLHQRVNQIQLTSDYNVITSVSYKFRWNRR